jgi:CDP-diacylglycerol--serine O-phosphatidyltransferase
VAEQRRDTRSVPELSLADAFSIANAVCGFFAVALLARGDFGLAGLEQGDVLTVGGLLVAGALFDILDGPVARWRGSSPIGETLDTLADVVTFAMTPAVLLAVAGATEGGHHPRVLLTAAAAFLVAVLVRLARFAVADSPEERRCFSGMPCPLATLAVFALLLLDPGSYAVAGGVGLTVWLMLSSVPYPKASRATAPLIAIWALAGAAGLTGMVPLDLVAAGTVAVVLGIPIVMAARGRIADVPRPA